MNNVLHTEHLLVRCVRVFASFLFAHFQTNGTMQFKCKRAFRLALVAHLYLRLDSPDRPFSELAESVDVMFGKVEIGLVRAAAP